MYTEFSVLLNRRTADTQETLIERAKQVFRTVDDLSFWYTSVSPTDERSVITALESPTGEELLTQRLDRTAHAKADQLTTVLRVVRDCESLEQAVQSRALVDAAKAVGAWNDPTAYIIDGVSNVGRPVISMEEIDEIVGSDRTSDELVLVNVKARY